MLANARPMAKYVPDDCLDPTPPPFSLASQGTVAVTLAGSGTATLNGTSSTTVSIIGGYFNIAAPYTTCGPLEATCPVQINQAEVDFADFTLDGHSVHGLKIYLDEQALTASGQSQPGNYFLFTIPQGVVFDAIATVDGHKTGLMVASAQELFGSINLNTGELVFDFNVVGTYYGKTLEVMGMATTAAVVALAPELTAEPVTVVNSPDSCTASVTLNASATSAAGLPVTITYIVDDQIVGSGASVTTLMSIGDEHDVTIIATDTNGMEDRVTETVTPTDTLGPVITVGSTARLWPPNHRYVTLSLDQCVQSVVDQCDGPLSPSTQGQITSVTSNELANAPGSGNTCNDIVIIDDTTVKLRAERDGGGGGRVYTVHFTVTDLQGNSTPATCTVQVPHDMSRASAPVTNDAPVLCVGTSCGSIPGPEC
jgi:hypothetical protein